MVEIWVLNTWINRVNMKSNIEKLVRILFLTGVFFGGISNTINSQVQVWTLDSCINYALTKNIDVQKSILTYRQSQLYTEQAKASRLPSVNASIVHSQRWSKAVDYETNSYGNMSQTNGTSFSLNSNVVLYNGMKINNQIKQSELNFQSNYYYSERVKESVELNILDAYLQVLYAQESVKNAEKQIDATTEQHDLAKQRLELGIISQSDYLQIKSELASEKLSLANAKSQLAIARVNLMQLMEISVNDSFAIESPNLDEKTKQFEKPVAEQIYTVAEANKPQVKQMELQKESQSYEEKIARADLYPSLSLGAGIGTSYSSDLTTFNYSDQLKNQLSPFVSLTLSIPIFQKKQVKTNIGIARIGMEEANLNLVNTKNELRKEIEQVTVNAIVAQEQFDAGVEEYNVAVEAINVANEKYLHGLMNAVDFLLAKTKLITAESNVLQSKYNLIFSYKVIDFYKGKPLTL